MRVFIDEPLNVKAWKTPLEAFFFFFKSTHVFSVFFGATVHVFPNFEYIVIPLKKAGTGGGMLGHARINGTVTFPNDEK